MNHNPSQIEMKVRELAFSSQSEDVLYIVHEYGLDLLPVLSKYLLMDLPIDVTERLESIYKVLIGHSFNGTISGHIARKFAIFQKELGFLLKYKSYAIKASNPLGFSIFIQNKGEGFSFQQHITHKTELFHVLEVGPGGYVFICDYEDWINFFDQASFLAWLSGQPDERYEKYRFNPRPGDVYIIDKLKVVHTVIGCIIEEYATISTDMVDRLYDQNAGKPIPSYYNRTYAYDRLKRIPYSNTSRVVDTRSKHYPPREIAPTDIVGGKLISLAHGSMAASRYIIDPFMASDFLYDAERAVSIYVTSGRGKITVADIAEMEIDPPPAIDVVKGDIIILPATLYYKFVNESKEPLELSEHRIPLNIALH